MTITPRIHPRIFWRSAQRRYSGTVPAGIVKMMVPSPMQIADTSDRPFGLTADIEVHLPMPPSVNRIWRANRAGKKRVSISPEYDAWRRHADQLSIALGSCRGVKKLTCKFEAEITLRRQKGDLDNRIKGVLDWAQSRELIADDKLCEKLTVQWGEAPHGCVLILRPFIVAPMGAYWGGGE